MNIRPIRDQVLIKCDNAEDVTKGGILLPDVAKDRPCKGTVIEVGPGKPYENLAGDMYMGARVPLNVRVGDKVFFQRFAGNVIDEKENLLLIRENEIMCVIEE